jgi:tRNA A37 N6-isopentenylltransferase MiaA
VLGSFFFRKERRKNLNVALDPGMLISRRVSRSIRTNVSWALSRGSGARHVHTAAVKPRVFVLAGCTGVGKTEMAIDLARRVDAEVISADSAQVYAGLDIGTNKLMPGAVAECGVPHHMLSCVGLDETMDAAEFAVEARRLTEEIHARGKHVILCGGSGFYIQWYIEGPGDAPAGTPDGRRKAEELYETLRPGGAAAIEEYMKLHHASAAMVAKAVAEYERNDHYRVKRQLEIIAALEDGSAAREGDARTEEVKALWSNEWKNKFEWRCVFVTASDRQWLWRKVCVCVCVYCGRLRILVTSLSPTLLSHATRL